LTAVLDPELPLYDTRTMVERQEASLLPRRASSWMIAAFSAAALILAVAGLFGIVTYSVGQRTHEIGIRMAVGADATRVRRHVSRQGVKLVASGLGAGLVGAALLSRVVDSILVGVSATEPLVYSAVTVGLLTVGALANYLPARRASSLDPMSILRGD
jgi:ABC-type antimicrobial peptide transport system permease subunit